MKLSGKPSELERRLREAIALMRRGLRAGEEVSAESILARYPELARHEDSAIDLIYGEFTIRAEMGQRPSPGAWLARFPAWRERIGRLLDLHEIFEDFDSGRGKSPDLVPPRLAEGTTRRFGRYDLQEVVGRGGEGIVYRAVERESGRTVALKLILEGVHAGARQRDQLRTAALACADLRHPNIVRVDEYGEEDGLPYLVLEYVAGRSLARAIGGRAQPDGRPWTALVEPDGDGGLSETVAGPGPVALAPDGRRVAWVGGAGEAVVLDRATWLPLGRATAPGGPVGRLASASNDRTIRLWDVATGLERGRFAGLSSYPAVVFSPDGAEVAAADEAGDVEVWDLASRETRVVLRGHKFAARAVAYSPDGKTLASGGDDDTVRLWDAITGQEFLTLPGHRAKVNAVAFDPTGSVLASGSHEGAVRLWHARKPAGDWSGEARGAGGW